MNRTVSLVRIIGGLSGAFLLAGYGGNAMGETRDVIYQVNSFRVDCMGVGPMECLQVKRGADPNGDWQLFYSQIEGFEYRPGYLYRLLVRETDLPPEQVPADASSIRYSLLETIEKAPDPRLAIHDIWVVRRIEGDDIDPVDPTDSLERPYLEFNVPRGDYLGNDGCESIHGEILTLGPSALRLGVPSSTASNGQCGDRSLQARLRSALERVAGWRRDGLWLLLEDAEGVEVVASHKTD